MTFMDSNLNYSIRVKLTDYGRKVHRENYERVWQGIKNSNNDIYFRQPKYRPPAEDKNGWSEWQLWYFMEIFGSYLGLTKEPVCLTDIQVEVENI